MLIHGYERVVCLCVDHRFRKEKERIEEMLFQRGVDIQWFIDGKGAILPRKMYNRIHKPPPENWNFHTNVWAHFDSMQTVIRQALRDNIRTLLFMEDDCVFTDDFDEVTRRASKEIFEAGLASKWEMLYYGANHFYARTEEVTPSVLRVFGSYTTHCVGLKRPIMEAIAKLSPTNAIDKAIANTLHHTRECYAIWPNVALQKPGYSYLLSDHANYNEFFKSKGRNWLPDF